MATKILFVDQSTTTQKMAAKAFAQERIEVIKVGNGDLATWVINQVKPDLVIADVSLPDRNGYELCRYIKGDPRLAHIPVVLLYWSDKTFDSAKADGARADAYIAKPFEPRMLVETAQKLIRDRGQRTILDAAPVPPPPLESAPDENDEPLDISDLFEGAEFNSYSQEADSEWESPIAIEEIQPQSDAALEGAAMPEPATVEKPSHRMIVPASDTKHEADSYAAPNERASTGTATGRGIITRRQSKARAAWAALAVLALALILWVWWAARIHKTQPDAAPSQAEQQPQPGPTPSPNTGPTLPPQEPTESKAVDRYRATEANVASGPRDNPGGDNPAIPSFKTNSDYTASRPESRLTSDADKADTTTSSAQRLVPTETNPDSAPPAKSDQAQQPPEPIVPGAATSPATTGDVNAGSASQQAMEPENGFRQFGSEVKGAVVWSGKKAGRGIKAIGKGLKKAFRHDPKLDLNE